MENRELCGVDGNVFSITVPRSEKQVGLNGHCILNLNNIAHILSWYSFRFFPFLVFNECE